MSRTGKKPPEFAGVLLGYLHGKEVASSFHRSLQDLITWDQTHNAHLLQWGAIKTEGMGIPDARNMLATQLLESPAEWLFMVDSDMGFDADSLDRLLEAADPTDRPMVGGLAFIQRETVSDRQGGFRWRPLPTMFQWMKHPEGKEGFTPRVHYPADQLVRVHGTGGAFVLIHRSVFEAIDGSWFDRVPGPDGKMMGEDLSFCVRVAAKDFPIHVHTGIRTTHQKTVWISDVDFWQSFNAPPASETVEVRVDGDGTDYLLSLRASTGLATGALSAWVFLCDDRARFKPGWLDHAQQVAWLYQAQVVEIGPYFLVRRGWLDTHVDWLGKAKADGVYQVSLASQVDAA